MKIQINAWYGWIPDCPDFRDQRYDTISAPPRSLPRKVDLRAGCSKVANQGAIGSCTALALVGNLEFLQKKVGKPVRHLSSLFVYYNGRAMKGLVKEDSGSAIRDGVKSLVKHGVCREPRWPYKVRKFAVKPPPACYVDGMERQATSYHRLVGLVEMRRCLAEGYPFVFGFSAYKSFEGAAVAKTGRLDLPKPTEKSLGGHAAMAVGYDDATKRLLVRNSWGTDWGLKGYFTLPYDYVVNDDLATDFWTLRAFEGA